MPSKFLFQKRLRSEKSLFLTFYTIFLADLGIIYDEQTHPVRDPIDQLKLDMLRNQLTITEADLSSS